MRSGKGPTTFVLVNVTSVDSIFEQQIPEVYSECRVGSSIMSKRLLAYNLDHNSTEEHKTQLRRVAYTSPRVFILTLRFVLAFLIRAIENTHTHSVIRTRDRRRVGMLSIDVEHIFATSKKTGRNQKIVLNRANRFALIPFGACVMSLIFHQVISHAKNERIGGDVR